MIGIYRTKHLAVQLHHFQQHILDKTIVIVKVATKYQRADIMTKALPRDAFEFLCKTISHRLLVTLCEGV